MPYRNKIPYLTSKLKVKLHQIKYLQFHFILVSGDMDLYLFQKKTS